MRNFIQDGHTLVLRAVRKLIQTDAPAAATDRLPTLVIEAIATRDWASLTFTGKLHRIELRLEGTADAVRHAVDRVTRGLPDADASMRGHLLAEAAATLVPAEPGEDATIARLRIDALTLDE